MNDDMLDLRRFFRHRFERYAIDRKSVTAEDLDGCSLTLQTLCDMLASDQEEVPPFLAVLIARRFGSAWVDHFQQRPTYGALAKAVRKQLSIKASVPDVMSVR